MFGLKKLLTTATIGDVTTALVSKMPESPKDQMAKYNAEQEVIKQIHNAYEVSSDKLLVEAKQILQQAENNDVVKGRRMSNLGFTNTKTAKLASTIVFEKNRAEETAKLIEYYSVNYPAYKFITEQSLSDINNKYSLVCVPAERYKGDIPDKNLTEIESFKGVKEEDKVYHGYDRSGYRIVRRITKNSLLTSLRGEETLWISCPASDAEVTADEMKGTYFSGREIPDPIVLQPVVGGFLIISKWGLEGADAELNSQSN